MRIGKAIALSALLSLITMVCPAQTARGIMSAPDMVIDPAEGVYDLPLRRLSLYSFCVGQTEGFPLLVFPDEDEKRIEEHIKDVFPYAYNISVFHLPDDPYQRSRKEILSLLDSAAEAASEGDVVMLYFSGHGQVASNPPYSAVEYYFMSSDSIHDRPQSTAVSGTEICRYAERIAGKGALALIFVDTCHSGALFPESVYLEGKGGLAFFASSSAGSQTIENGFLRSTDFTETLVSLLRGDGMKGDLTVETIAESLGAPTAGNVRPKLFNASGRVVLRSVNTKKQYRLRQERYDDYILQGRSALERADYPRAFFEFAEAHHMERGLRAIDKEDFSEDVLALNRAVAAAVTQYEESPRNPEWKKLALIDERAYDLDIQLVDMESLYLGCGRHFNAEKDYAKAYSFFRKAHDKGNRMEASYFMAKLAETNLPGTLSNAEVKRLYEEAKANGYDVEGYAKARAELNRRAVDGDVGAQYLLGKYYYEGDTLGFKVNYQKAVEWLTKAAQKKHPDALVYLGYCYQFGEGVSKDMPRAYECFKEASARGSLLGEYYVAMIEFWGVGMKSNAKKALKTYEKLSEKGFPYAQFDLGLFYLYGIGVKTDYRRGESYLLKAASSGFVKAQSELGEYYAFTCEPREYEKAFYWTKKAVEGRSDSAMNTMGNLYLNGYEVEKNDSLAFHYYSLAARQGNAKAYGNLARCYIEGVFVEQNQGQAEKWLARAEESEVGTISKLGELYAKLGVSYLGLDEAVKGLEVDNDKGFRYLKIAEEKGVKGETAALLHGALGYCYAYGLGTESNGEEAVRYFSMAAEEGNTLALNVMGILYYEGVIVDKDEEKALSLFRRVDEAGDHWGAQSVAVVMMARGDTLAALPYYKKAAEAGNPSALEMLGCYYFYGFKGVKQSYGEAQSYLESAYQLGQKDNTVRGLLDWLYRRRFERQWRAGQYSEAYRWVEKEFNIENPIAWLYLGRFYEKGEVVERNEKKAKECYVKSYDEGFRGKAIMNILPETLMWLLEDAYKAGDYQSAAAYGKKAANLGSASGLLWYGYMCHVGKGVEKNRNKAIECYEWAYEQRQNLSEGELANLGIYYYALFEEEFKEGKDYKIALEWCERSIVLGNKEAEKQLAKAWSKANS